MKFYKCISFFASAVVCHWLPAGIIASWDTAGGVSTISGNGSAYVAAGDLHRGSGIELYSGSTFNSKGFDQTSFSSAVGSGDLLGFSITVASGYQVTDLVISSGIDRSGSGPVEFAFAVQPMGSTRFVQVGSSLSVPETGDSFVSDSIAGSWTGVVDFAIVAWNGSSAAGTFDIEDGEFAPETYDLFIEGMVSAVSAIPEPSSILPFTALFIGALLIGRRRS